MQSQKPNKRVLMVREWSAMYSVGVQIRGKEGGESIIGSSYRKKRKLREGVETRTLGLHFLLCKMKVSNQRKLKLQSTPQSCTQCSRASTVCWTRGTKGRGYRRGGDVAPAPGSS